MSSCNIGLLKELKLDIQEGWKGYDVGIFLKDRNNNVKVNEILYRFIERENGKLKVTSTLKFLRVYITEWLCM